MMMNSRNASAEPKVISYTTLRKTVGIIGITLPIILVVGSIAVGGCKEILGSLSSYYHTDMQHVFIAIISATAFFMFAYKGYDKGDNRAANIAGVFALGVAFFPESATEPLPACINETMENNVINAIHYISAAGFFLALSYFSLFVFTKKSENPTSMKLKRNTVYRICGYIMLGCLLLITAYSICSKNGGCEVFKSLNPIFWLEALALWAFGFSWFTKGNSILADK